MSLNDTTEYITRSTTATASIIYRTLRFIDITNINSLITAISIISYGFNIIKCMSTTTFSISTNSIWFRPSLYNVWSG